MVSAVLGLTKKFCPRFFDGAKPYLLSVLFVEAFFFTCITGLKTE
jgi:hypothetical protein